MTKIVSSKGAGKKSAPKKTQSQISKQKKPIVVKAHSSLDEKTKDGAFKRTDAGFRNMVSKTDKRFKPEKDRYHLYISWACPWANRCAQVRQIKGLQKVIGLTVVHPTWKKSRPGQDEHAGWCFTAKNESVPTLNGFGENKFSDTT